MTQESEVIMNWGQFLHKYMQNWKNATKIRQIDYHLILIKHA